MQLEWRGKSPDGFLPQAGSPVASPRRVKITMFPIRRRFQGRCCRAPDRAGLPGRLVDAFRRRRARSMERNRQPLLTASFPEPASITAYAVAIHTA